MIKTFKKQTKPLTQKELEAVEFICNYLKTQAVGKENVKDNKRISIILKYNSKMQCNFKEARIRKILNHIRINNLVKNLVASGKGYYISNSRAEVRDYLMEQLRGRAEAIAKLFNSYDFTLKMEIKIKEKDRQISQNITLQKQLFND